MQFGRWIAVAVLLLAGCGGGSETKSTGLDPQAVRARADMYSMYMAQNKSQPPKDEATFRQFLASQQSALETSGVTIDQMFASPRNGEPLNWVYGKRGPTVSGISVLAYESKSADGQRLLLGDRGMYITVNDAELKRAFPDAQ